MLQHSGQLRRLPGSPTVYVIPSSSTLLNALYICISAARRNVNIKEPPAIPNGDPLFGKFIAISMTGDLKTPSLPHVAPGTASKARSKTFTLDFLSTKFIYNIEPESMEFLSNHYSL